MSSPTVLVAASILAAAIAYAGYQLRGSMIVASPERTGDVFAIFQLINGRVRYCEGTASVGVACSGWSAE
jgi:hypothetical protein